MLNVSQEAEESSSALGSLHSSVNGRFLPQSSARRWTTHGQFPTVGGGSSLMSARDDKDSGYVGSTSSRQAAWSQSSRRGRTSGNCAAHAAIKRRCGSYTTINFTHEFRNVSVAVTRVGALSAAGWAWSARGRHTLRCQVGVADRAWSLNEKQT